MIKKGIEKIKDLMQKTSVRRKLKEMDDWWYFSGASSWGLFPPSFYYTHTEEEIKRITDETLDRLRTMIAEFEAENQSTE